MPPSAPNIPEPYPVSLASPPTPTTPGTDVVDTGKFIESGESQLITAQDLIGSLVIGGDGRGIATVSDLMLDRQGRVSGYLCVFGSYIGPGCKVVAISAQHAQQIVDEGGHVEALVTDLTPADLENVSPFTRVGHTAGACER